MADYQNPLITVRLLAEVQLGVDPSNRDVEDKSCAEQTGFDGIGSKERHFSPCLNPSSMIMRRDVTLGARPCDAISTSPPANDREEPIVRWERLGGLLKYDHRQAARIF